MTHPRVHPTRHNTNRPTRAFTLTELLIVIGIMGVLIGILIPVVSGVRTRAWEANSRNNLQVLSAAIDAYQRDFDAYPGPISNDVIESRNPNPSDLNVRIPSGVGGFLGSNDTVDISLITMSENLTLGLLGGLRVDASDGLVYDPSSVGQGPASLNPRKPTRTKAYLSDSKLLLWRVDGNLKTGKFQDDRGAAGDTIIPEFGDGFPEGLPVLYMRARNETRNEASAPRVSDSTPGNNDVVIDQSESTSANRGRGPYHINQILGYTSNSNPIGVGTHGLNSVSLSNPAIPKSGPINAYAFLLDPATPSPAPRGKGRYLLINAGADRTYGTQDDITSFGRVGD